MTYFKKVDCIEELKKQYFSLAKEYHPDINKNGLEIMQAINSEYDRLFTKYRDVHRNIRKDGGRTTYTSTTATAEAPEDFRDIINQLIILQGLQVELCGRWLWVSGETLKHKDILKTLGCKWSKAKKMWSWHFAEDGMPFYHRKNRDMGYIRETYGSQKYGYEEKLALN